MGAVQRVELELPGTAHHELVSYRVLPDSPVAQGKRIPRWARPSLVVRDGRSMRLHEAGRPQEGDYVYIFTPPRFIDLLARLFASRLDLDHRGKRKSVRKWTLRIGPRLDVCTSKDTLCIAELPLTCP
jgi:NhaP-type Na+/H+ and K+/H+ antiporter